MVNRRRSENIWQWLVEAGEEKVAQFADEILSNPGVTEALAGALRRAVHTKGQVDRNIERFLGALNLPSRADYAKLVSKIEAMQGSLVNLSIKLDRVLAEREPRRRAAPRRSPGS